jgi:hypothetical protein
MELANFLEKNQRLQLQIQVAILNITLYRTMCNLFFEKINKKSKLLWIKHNFFWHPTLQPLGSFSDMAESRSSSKITRKMNLIQEK